MSYAEFVKALKHKISERTVEVEESLGKGAAQDFAGYREKVGEIRGLRSAGDIAAELLKATLEDDDDDFGG
jgi:hypothetical protein